MSVIRSGQQQELSLASSSSSSINISANKASASASRRLFGGWRRRSDATELFDYDDYDEDGAGDDNNAEGDNSSSSRGRAASALKRSLVRRWAGRAHSTGRAASASAILQRPGSAERTRPSSTGRHRQGSRTTQADQLPATPSVLATPAAALATPAVLMASYDSAKGRLPPSASGRFKTPYQERMAYLTSTNSVRGGALATATRPTPVNFATLKRELQQARPAMAKRAIPEDAQPIARQEQAPSRSAPQPQQQQQQPRQRRSTMPGPLPKNQNLQSQKQPLPSHNKMLRRASHGHNQPEQLQHHEAPSQQPRRLTSFLNPRLETDMQAQHAADKKLIANNAPTAVFQQPHTTIPAPAPTTTNTTTTTKRMRPQQRSPMMQARLDRRLQSAHVATLAAANSTKLYEMPNGSNFSSSVVPPIAEHPTPSSSYYDNDAASTSWEEDSVMSAGRADLLVPAVRRPSASSRASSPHRGGYGAGGDKLMQDSSSSWHSRGSDDSGASPTQSHRQKNKSPSPQSDAIDSPYEDDDDEMDHSGDQFLMMDMDVVDALPRSFPRARKIFQQQQQNRHRVQLPEYYRSYNFTEDPSAIQPKIRKREPGELRDGSSSLAGTAMSSASRTSLCSVSTSRSPFSVRSESVASCLTSSTQGSTQSAATAPPNLWEVDRHMHKKKRNVETHTDFVKFVLDPEDENHLSKAQTIVLTTGNDTASSPWKGEAKGVPHKVSISFRRLTLRTQVRELKELLEENAPSKMTTSSTIPPTPPFAHRSGVVVTREDLQLESTSKKKKGKASIRASI